MAAVKESEMQIRVQSHKEGELENGDPHQAQATLSIHGSRLRYSRFWWLSVAFNILMVIFGQSAATILGKLYFAKGGKSKWLATLVQTAAFPVLIPFIFFSSKIKLSNGIATVNTHRTPISTTIAVYLILGIMIAGDNMMYTYGAAYLPASTFSLICATQLAFNCVFSFFLNSQHLTPFILNSVLLLILSSILLAFQSGNGQSTDTTSQYSTGIIFNLCASALFALILSLMQFSFQKIFKKETFSAVLDMQIYTSLVASMACVIGLFASGEWGALAEESGEFKLGRTSYILVNLLNAISWQICFVGTVGLVFTVSSLFSNAISTLALPLIPVLSVFILHDKITATKIVALILSLWGCLSFVYQQYLEAGGTPLSWSFSASKRKRSGTTDS
ncbi:probable purine permease 11 [Nymphaea colorata]|nr:probable purine permease 11 [Nymphaea colorata]